MPPRAPNAKRSRTDRVVTATAPSRIDLAGGTLDIWPISSLVPGAMTVNVAIELPATVVVEPRRDGRLKVVSKDRRHRTTQRLPLEPAAIKGPLSLLLRLASSFELGRGAGLTCAAAAPAGAGLGGSSTLAVAVSAALGRFTGTRFARDRLLRRVMNLEALGLAQQPLRKFGMQVWRRGWKAGRRRHQRSLLRPTACLVDE